MTSKEYLRTSLLAWREDQVGKVLSLQMLVPEVNSQILIKFSGIFLVIINKRSLNMDVHVSMWRKSIDLCPTFLKCGLAFEVIAST